MTSARKKEKPVLPYKKPKQANLARARQNGYKTGHAAGYEYGYHLGACHAVINQVRPLEIPLFNLHVAFVREGGLSLNDGVIEGLSGLVSKLTVFDALEDAAGLLRGADSRPDLVLVLNGLHGFPVEQADRIRELGIPTAVWFNDDPYFSDRTVSIAPHYDYVFTHEISCIPLYLEAGCPQVHYLPLAASVEMFKPRAVPLSMRTDVLFVGTAFWNRVELFDSLMSRLRQYRFRIIGGLWDRLKEYDSVADRIMLSGAGPEETADYYCGAKIVINLHRSADNGEHNFNSREIIGQSINPRTFEVNATGALQLTDVRDDLSSHYTIGDEIETYQSASELASKLDYYLAHEDERRKLALRAVKRTYSEHTYRHRLYSLLMTVSGQKS